MPSFSSCFRNFKEKALGKGEDFLFPKRLKICLNNDKIPIITLTFPQKKKINFGSRNKLEKSKHTKCFSVFVLYFFSILPSTKSMGGGGGVELGLEDCQVKESNM